MRRIEEVNDQDWKNITSYMNGEIREDVHDEMAPCTRTEFILAYLKKDPGFIDTLEDVFDVDERKHMKHRRRESK